MLSSFKSWTFLLPGGLLALLVRGSTPDPTSLLVAQVRQTFEESKVNDTATLFLFGAHCGWRHADPRRRPSDLQPRRPVPTRLSAAACWRRANPSY